MDGGDLAVIGGLLVAYALVSRRLAGSVLSAPLLFLVGGVVFGVDGLGTLAVDADLGVIRALAEATLALVLFADASKLDLRLLRHRAGLPVRLLGVGLPVTIIVGALVAALLLPELMLAEALVLAVLLAPTDAALGQAVVSDERVPEDLRDGLSVESGLNDGVCVPLLFAAIAMAELEEAPSFEGEILTDLVTEVGMAVLVGALASVVVAWLRRAAVEHGWIETPWLRILPLAVAGLAYVLTDLAGGSGFIGAFVAGIVWSARVGPSAEGSMDLIEEVGALLSAATFILFAAVLVGPALRDAGPEVFAYAVLSLTVVRMGPVALALAGTRSGWPTVAFAGWFGPRGLATIVFALVLVEESGLPGTDLIVTVATITVALSVLAHGLTAPPLTARYAAWLGRESASI
jgi:NhaP-type Na+/H+ or K+/H+ antiporter